jgi:hypothetical protein|nr:hypothetical protein [uncultured Schaedlerella sp.]
MENRYYMVAIVDWPVECADDPVAAKCFPKTYEDATAIARPWVEMGHDVVITTRKYEHDEGEYIEIPLDTQRYIKNLTTEQAGVVFKNIYSYFFGNAKLRLEDDAVKNATENTIKRIKEYAKNGES